MEVLLELPLEALALRYSGTIAGYIWTCLALFAAGIGLWRLRLLGSASSPASAPSPKSPSADVSLEIQLPPLNSAPIVSVMVEPYCREHEESGTSTKGRFTAYFLLDEEIDDGDKGDEYEWESYKEGGCSDLSDWGWRGDLGWYTYQDWKAINGSVVRLWDGCQRRSMSAPAVMGR